MHATHGEVPTVTTVILTRFMYYDAQQHMVPGNTFNDSNRNFAHAFKFPFCILSTPLGKSVNVCTCAVKFNSTQN